MLLEAADLMRPETDSASEPQYDHLADNDVSQTLQKSIKQHEKKKGINRFKSARCVYENQEKDGKSIGSDSSE